MLAYQQSNIFTLEFVVVMRQKVQGVSLWVTVVCMFPYSVYFLLNVYRVNVKGGSDSRKQLIQMTVFGEGNRTESYNLLQLGPQHR